MHLFYPYFIGMNHIFKHILLLALLCLIIAGAKPQLDLEGLTDYGEKRYTETAPLAYERFATSIKYPTLITDPTERAAMEDITQYGAFTPVQFNKSNLQKYYSQSEMEQDFKYFNNASNLSLHHLFNPVDGITDAE